MQKILTEFSLKYLYTVVIKYLYWKAKVRLYVFFLTSIMKQKEYSLNLLLPLE